MLLTWPSTRIFARSKITNRFIIIHVSRVHDIRHGRELFFYHIDIRVARSSPSDFSPPVSRSRLSDIGNRAASSVCPSARPWTDISASPFWTADGTCCAGFPIGRSSASTRAYSSGRPTAGCWQASRPLTRCATGNRNRCRRTTAVCARICVCLQQNVIIIWLCYQNDGRKTVRLAPRRLSRGRPDYVSRTTCRPDVTNKSSVRQGPAKCSYVLRRLRLKRRTLKMRSFRSRFVLNDSNRNRQNIESTFVTFLTTTAVRTVWTIVTTMFVQLQIFYILCQFKTTLFVVCSAWLIYSVSSQTNAVGKFVNSRLGVLIQALSIQNITILNTWLLYLQLISLESFKTILW